MDFVKIKSIGNYSLKSPELKVSFPYYKNSPSALVS